MGKIDHAGKETRTVKYVGAHVSAQGGVENAPLAAGRIKARAFALFTKNQRQWRARPLMQKISEAACLSHIAESINMALDRTRGVTAVIENTAGQGSSVGYRFEHLIQIIDRVEDKTRVGVCLDTCHTFAAGYDPRTKEACDAALKTFDRVVGFQYPRAMHVNDST